MKLKKLTLYELNFDSHLKKKIYTHNHLNFGLCYLILVSGKFLEKNFFFDIYFNFKSILTKFLKKIIFNTRYLGGWEIIEIILEENYFQKLLFFYSFVKSFLKKFPILMSSKSFLILHLSFFSGKKPMILKNLNLKFSQIKKSPTNQYFIQFVEFQRGNCKKRKDLHQFISKKYRTSKIYLFQNLIYQKKWRKDFCSNYISVRLNHKKTFKTLFQHLIFMINCKKTFEMLLRKKTKEIFFKKKKRNFFSRNHLISPSYSRTCKTFFQEFSVFLRGFFIFLTNNLLLLVIFQVKQENPDLNFLYFNIIKYLPKPFFKIKIRYIDCFAHKIYLYSKKKLFRCVNNFLFKHDNRKTKNKKILVRKKINLKKSNWIKHTSFFLKNLNSTKFKMTRNIDKIGWVFKKFSKSILIQLYGIQYKENSIFLKTDRFKAFKNFKKKMVNIDSSFFYSFNIIEKFQTNLKLFNMFGFWTSSLFNVRNNNKILKRFLDIETVFCFEYWIYKIKNLGKIFRILKNMKNTEKIFLKKIFKFYLFKRYQALNFFLINFLEIEYKNLTKYQRDKCEYSEFFQLFINFNQTISLKFHPYNFFLLVIFEVSSPFFFNGLNQWLINFNENSKIIRKIVGISFHFYEKSYESLGNWFNFKFQEKLISLKFTKEFKKMRFYLSRLIITLLSSNEKNNEILLKTIMREDFFLKSFVKKFSILNKKKRIFQERGFLQIIILVVLNYTLFSKREALLISSYSIFLFWIKEPLKFENLFYSIKFFFLYNTETDLLGELETIFISKIQFFNFQKKLLESSFKTFSNFNNSILIKNFSFLENNLNKNNGKKDVFKIFFHSPFNESTCYFVFYQIYNSINSKKILLYFGKKDFSNKKFCKELSLLLFDEKVFHQKVCFPYQIIFKKIERTMRNHSMLINSKKFIYFLLFLISNFPKTINDKQNKSLLKKLGEFSEPEYKFFLESFTLNITDGMKIFK